MGEAAQTLTKVFAVRFAQANRWDPNSFHSINWHWPASVMATIGSVLNPRKEKVDRSANGLKDLMPVTIHFDGSIEPRKVSEDKEYTMDLFWARPGDIVVSKIDLKNGAVAIIPDGWNKVVVTNHFAVYEPNLKKLDPRYFHLLIQSKFFKEHLWRNKVGAEGRKEVKLDFFESQEVPIPPLPIQQKIVAHWEAAEARISSANEAIKKLLTESDTGLLKSIGIQVPKIIQLRGHFTIPFSHNDRWDTFFFRKDFILLENLIKSMPYAPLGDVVNFISRSWDKEDFKNGEFEYIEISSVTKKDGIVSTRKIKVDEAPSRATTKVRAGDLIISTTRPYLGAFAIVDDKYDGCVCSSGFALADSMKRDDIKKEFVLLFLKSPAGLRQLERRMSGGLYPAIVQSELEKILIPIPSLEKQEEIIAIFRDNQEKIQTIEHEKHRIRNEVARQIEQMILGTRPVGVPLIRRDVSHWKKEK